MSDTPVIVTAPSNSGVPFNDEPIEYEYSRERGLTAFLGGGGRYAESLSRFNTWVAQGCSPVQLRSAGAGLYRVLATATAGSSGEVPPASPDSQIVDSWMVLGNMIEKDGWEHVKLQTIRNLIATHFGGGDATDALTRVAYYHALAVLRSFVDAILAGETSITYIPITGSYPSWTFGSAVTVDTLTLQTVATLLNDWGCGSTYQLDFLQFISAQAQGVTKYPTTQYVLKLTQYGPLSSSLRGLRENVNRMLTSARMVASRPHGEAVPSTLLDDIPAGFWLKLNPQVSKEGDRIKVEYEYWWAESYLTFYLGDPVGPS